VDRNELFSGTYAYVAYSGTDGLPDEANATWGDLVADGAGTITGGTLSENENGIVTPPSGQPVVSYRVDASRTFSLLAGGTAVLTGRIAADGSVACLSAVTNGESPAIVILGRKSGTWNDADLTGPYHFATVVYVPGGGRDIALWGTATFDGFGGGSANGTENDNGAIAPGGILTSYAVTSDGSLTASLYDGQTSGAIVAGGDLVLLAGVTTNGGNPTLYVLTRATSGASNALLDGSYALIGMEAPLAPPPEWVSTLVAATADGAGTCTLAQGARNADGSVAPFSGSSLPYAVAPDGLFDFGSGNFLGGVAPTGDFAVCAGGTSGGSDPQLLFFLR
jgi:hypothetical protein